MTTANATPLLDGTIVTHAHVSAHVQHRIDGILVADVTLHGIGSNGSSILMLMRRCRRQLNGGGGFALAVRLLLLGGSIQTVAGFGYGGGVVVGW